MPLTVNEDHSAILSDLKDNTVLIFFADVVDGQMWCPDCRATEPTVKDAFESSTAWNGVIVRVGDKPTWKSPSNKFRQDPWKVTSIPTLIRLDSNGKEVGRLVDPDPRDANKLQAFLAA